MVVAKIATTTQHGAIEGKTQSILTQFYNLDAIISVGYRVNSRRATNFRIWATGVLKEYMIKGFAMDDERLKQSKTFLAKTISVNFWKEFALSVRANAVSGNKSPTFLQNVASTITKALLSPVTFTQ